MSKIYSKTMISESLEYIGNKIPSGSKIVLHVSLKDLFDNKIEYKNQSSILLSMVRDFLQPSEIFIPTFTYSFTNGKIFDVKNSPSEVGRFSEEIRKIFYNKKKRTLDPVFSVVETENSFKSDNQINKQAFGNSSIWKYLNDNSHYIININMNEPLVATQLHFLEFENNVPYRYMKKFNGTFTDWNGKEHMIEYDYYVRDLKLNPIWNRAKIVKEAKVNSIVLQHGSVTAFEWLSLSKFLNLKIWNNSKYLIN
jgi:aminoglycoside 3-N-acetyltransferase